MPTLDDLFPAARPSGLTRSDWLSLLRIDPRTPAGKGELRAVRDRASGRITPRQGEVLDALLATPIAPQEYAPVPAPPWGEWRPRPADEPGRQLTAAELAWLDRLPNDPAQTSDTDAQRLAQLAREVGGAGDAWMVGARWEPLQAHHRKRAHEVEQLNRIRAHERPVHGGPGTPGAWSTMVRHAFDAELGDMAESELADQLAKLSAPQTGPTPLVSPLAGASPAAPPADLLRTPEDVRRAAMDEAQGVRAAVDSERLRTVQEARQALHAGPPPGPSTADLAGAMARGAARAAAEDAQLPRVTDPFTEAAAAGRSMPSERGPLPEVPA